MKKILLGGTLVASMFMQVVNADKPAPTFSKAWGANSISGEGCAFSTDAQHLDITLTSSDKNTHEKHKKQLGGTHFTRTEKFEYDVSHIVMCGAKHVRVTLSQTKGTNNGVWVVSAGFKGKGNTFLLDSGSKVGEVELEVVYHVENPEGKLTNKFNYTHDLQIMVQAEW